MSVCLLMSVQNGQCYFPSMWMDKKSWQTPFSVCKNGNPNPDPTNSNPTDGKYIGWSDVTYLWSQCDRHFVGQHVVLCVVRWWRFVVLFEWNWISWFKKMPVLSLSYWESDVYWRQNNKNFSPSLPHKMAKTADMKKLCHCHPMYSTVHK